MPKLTVQKNSNATPKDAFEKVSTMLSNASDLKKLDPAYKCEFNAGTMTGKAAGKMFSADLKVAPSGSGSTIEIIVDLPLTLALAKGMIQKTLEKKLDEALA
jgi:hypothetical protein